MAKKSNKDTSEENKNPLKNVNMVGGLNTDTSVLTQPEGTSRFVLNGVNETKEGDLGLISTEESNELSFNLPSFNNISYVPIGKVYVGDKNNVIFFAHPEGHSAIGVLDFKDSLIVYFTDENQSEKMGFSISNQIDAVYRLRRGCERTIYWVDPIPRFFNLDVLEDFKTEGKWDISKFSLFRGIISIPEIDDIEVVDGGGVLPPGSYNISIRYLDENFNPTQFTTSSETVMIYNDPLSKEYKNINGSTKLQNEYTDYEDTTKAIKIRIKPESLDKNYPFYQVAVTEANSGSGNIVSVKVSQKLSTLQPYFYYTGQNYESEIAKEELTIPDVDISSATSIEQIENRLILGDIKGSQVSYCGLQKYASKISADLVTKEINLTNHAKSNAKDPLAFVNGVGYMPGEVYSFGIVYILEDKFGKKEYTPVYHIPGKSSLVSESKVYSEGENVFPMSKVDNLCETTRYLSNGLCGSDSYWGVDCEGNSLESEQVRHHRFPLRSDLDLPLYEELEKEETSWKTKSLHTLAVTPNNTELPQVCEEDSTQPCVPVQGGFGSPVTREIFQVTVKYRVYKPQNITEREDSYYIDPLDFSILVGTTPTTGRAEYDFSTPEIENASDIEVISLIETFEDDTENEVIIDLAARPWVKERLYTGVSTATNMVYSLSVKGGTSTKIKRPKRSNIFGIKFSGIQKPDPAEFKDKTVVGYYIVRNERLESDRTVLDTGILLPTLEEGRFVSQGLLFPEFADATERNSKIKKDMLGFISPEHKFFDKKYFSLGDIIQQGVFTKEDSKAEIVKSRIKINDVADGSGYVDGKHKDGEKDIDGMSLQVKTRDNFPAFKKRFGVLFEQSDIKDLVYLNALEDQVLKDSEDKEKEVFNLAADNKIGAFSLNEKYSHDNHNELPYVVFRRKLLEMYPNFRTTPYYKETENPNYFEEEFSTVEIFNGDSHINSMHYVNSIYYDTRIKKRVGKKKIINIVLGAIAILGAIALAIIAPGLGTAAAIAVGSAAGALLSASVLLLNSGITQGAWNKAYNEKYDKGLRDTIEDDYLRRDIDAINSAPVIVGGKIVADEGDRGFKKNPSDDEIQWLGEAINIWVESNFNIGLRYGSINSLPDFLDSPEQVVPGTTYPEKNREYFGVNSVWSGGKKIEKGSKHEDVLPTTPLDFHMFDKLTFLSNERKNGRSYTGIALAELYKINPDYQRRNKQTFFNHLPIEYDCCSDCVEEFPHRFHWSEQSFQEELSDNFKKFLPNNYKDVEGETGRITDIFRIQNNLYIHTEESLWHCPQTFQERVTEDIISFIGTGEYFSVPPRKIVDDANSSAGNTEKWGRIKTKYGVFFPCLKEGKFYLFNGENLEPVTDLGNSRWFKNNMPFIANQKHIERNGVVYPYLNNPSNPIGVGFISAYDTEKERLIITKKDMYDSTLTSTDYFLCTKGDDIYVIENYKQVIADRKADGWTLVGIVDCNLEFTKSVVQEEIKQIPKKTYIDLDTTIFVMYEDNFSQAYIDEITEIVTEWKDTILAAEGFRGEIVFAPFSGHTWLSSHLLINETLYPKVLAISFMRDSNTTLPATTYHGIASPPDYSGQPTASYNTDYLSFINHYPLFGSFQHIVYSLTLVEDSSFNSSKNSVLQVLASIKGRNYTTDELSKLIQPASCTPGVWSTIKSLLLQNVYNTLRGAETKPGLEQYGVKAVIHRGFLGFFSFFDNCPVNGVLITQCQFNLDMFTVLGKNYTDYQEVVEYKTVVLKETHNSTLHTPNYIDYSWTISYSLKYKTWISLHSYLPSMYLANQEKLYSWRKGINSFYRHNIKGKYRSFYGQSFPFIIEYVDNPYVIGNKIWESVQFTAEAYTYDSALKEFKEAPNAIFNKALFYTAHQTSGLVDLVLKSHTSQDFFKEQTKNISLRSYIIDRNENLFTINDIRDIRKDYENPMFIQDVKLINEAGKYFIDKIINDANIADNADWTQVENFRDKYLVVRLIFDNFANVKLTFNFSELLKTPSER